jgi:excisionase family DNA binding protein
LAIYVTRAANMSTNDLDHQESTMTTNILNKQQNGHHRGGDPDAAAMAAESGPAPKVSLQGLGIAPLLLTEEQAAELLGLSSRKVWELAACGAIPSVKIGTLKRYRLIDLQEWVQRGCPTSPE